MESAVLGDGGSSNYGHRPCQRRCKFALATFTSSLSQVVQSPGTSHIHCDITLGSRLASLRTTLKRGHDQGRDFTRDLQGLLTWLTHVVACWLAGWLCLQNRPPDWQDFVGIIVLLLINSTISFVEENNAGNAAAALMARLAPKTKVTHQPFHGSTCVSHLVLVHHALSTTHATC